MGRYKTVATDDRGEIILVPEIPDPIGAGTPNGMGYCNFCIFNEDRSTGALIPAPTSDRCESVVDDNGHDRGCVRDGNSDRIFIYRHELKEYKARAIVAKMNRGQSC